MDITVADAVVSRDITGRSKSNFGVEIMFIRRNRIRFIHFPGAFNIIMKIQENVRNVKRLWWALIAAMKLLILNIVSRKSCFLL